MTRRIAILIVVCASACQVAGPRHERVVAGVRFVEVAGPEVGKAAPLVVALHGLGGSPEGLASRLWPEVPPGVEVALPQAPLAAGAGWQWFEWPRGLSEAELADAIAAADDRLWPAILALAHGRKVIVCGFSQGAVLAYAMAARHADVVALAIPIAGRAPYALLHRGHEGVARVYALHGTDDDRIPVEAGRGTVAAIVADGGKAELKEFAGVGHTITAAMRTEVLRVIKAESRSPETPRR
jgi:phospholipase/carboxylesterase